MHLKSTFAGILLVCAAMIVSSCVSDPILPSQTELYNREFIKNFGVFDSNHDWNYSQQASVNVTTSVPTDIKIYANVGGKRYLFGTFLGVNGSQELKVDVPKNINSLIVRANGKDIVASVGGKVNLGNGSRVVKDPTSEGGTGITAELVTDEKNWMVVPMLNATMFRSKMPEGCYNANREGVAVDFTFKFKENDIIVRPLYWQTNQTLSLGFFYIGDDGKPVRFPVYDMEKTSNYSDDLALCYAPTETKSITVKDYINDEKFMSFVKANGINVITQSSFYNATETAEIIDVSASDNFNGICTALDDHNMTYACRAYLESLGYVNDRDADNPYNYVYRWHTVGDVLIKRENGTDQNAGLWHRDLEIIFTYYKYKMEDAKGFGDNTDMIYNMRPFDEKGYPALVSKGIKVHIDDISRTYGAYIRRGDGRYLYSVSSLNEKNRWIPKPGAERTEIYYDWQSGRSVLKYKQADFIIEEGKKAYRAATWKGEKYPWRYMSFEDGVIGDTYNPSSCDFDMQDFVFLIDNVEPSTDDPIEIVTPDDPVEDIPYEWIIAVEDLGSTDDFDFNDIVFGVSNPVEENGKKTVTIRALASGGTLPVYIRYKNEDIKPEGTIEGEFHSWFDGSYPSNVVINAQGVRTTGRSYKLAVDDDFTLSCCEGVVGGNMGGFSVRVIKKDNHEVTDIMPPSLNKDGNEAPQMICVPTTWQWPTERTHIGEAYDKFAEWTQNQNVHTNWHETVTNQSLVWKRDDIPAAK